MQILQTGFECFFVGNDCRVAGKVWLEGDGSRSQNSVSHSVK